MGRKSEFSREEKIAAVRLTTDGGRTVLSVANEYGVHENTIIKWKRVQDEPGARVQRPERRNAARRDRAAEAANQGT